MSRHRYDAIPQRSNSIPPPPPSSNSPYDPIILSPIPVSTPSHNYNNNYSFNTGLPTSIASQSNTSQTPSIPNSPPPSFHTFSSPGTPRPTPSTRTVTSASTGSGIAGPYGELWGVAESTVGGEGLHEGVGMRGGDRASATSNDALNTIEGLKQRVEWLEESIGRLLLEKEQCKNRENEREGDHEERNNCCISFTDASPDVERAIMRGRSNCCVSFRRAGEKREKRERKRNLAVLVAVLGFAVLVVLVTVHSLKPHARGEYKTKQYLTKEKGVGEVSE